jgi:hypothetical protein
MSTIETGGLKTFAWLASNERFSFVRNGSSIFVACRGDVAAFALARQRCRPATTRA